MLGKCKWTPRVCAHWANVSLIFAISIASHVTKLGSLRRRIRIRAVWTTLEYSITFKTFFFKIIFLDVNLPKAFHQTDADATLVGFGLTGSLICWMGESRSEAAGSRQENQMVQNCETRSVGTSGCRVVRKGENLLKRKRKPANSITFVLHLSSFRAYYMYCNANKDLSLCCFCWIYIFTARKRSLRRLCFYRCLSVHGGACMVARGGMHGCSGGGHAWLLGGCAWLLPGGHAWLLPGGACMVAPGGEGMHGCSGGHVGLLGGHAWLLWGGMRGCLGGMCGCSGGGMRGCSQGGMCGCLGACVVARGACMVAPGGCAWFLGGLAWFFPWDTVNEQAVRILLECILVTYCSYFL